MGGVGPGSLHVGLGGENESSRRSFKAELMHVVTGWGNKNPEGGGWLDEKRKACLQSKGVGGGEAGMPLPMTCSVVIRGGCAPHETGGGGGILK